MLRFLSVIFLFAFASPALADLSGEALDHGRAAFASAKKKDWNHALEEAKETHDAILLKLITWQYMRDPDSGAKFDDIIRFIEANPQWPALKKLRVRAELALRDTAVPDNDVIAWFADDTPATGVGKLALAEALMRHQMGSGEKIEALIRGAWKDGDFDMAGENKILGKYGDLLTEKDHIARIDRLLWEEKIAPAQRLLDKAPADYRKLFQARRALMENKRLAVFAVFQVPGRLKKDPGLLYDRMRWRAQRGDDSGVREILLAAPAAVPYPEKWWKQRESQVRQAIAEGDYALARRLLAHHAQVEGAEQAEALWLQGWLLAEFLGEPGQGYKVFSQMYDDVHYPVSKARAAYWAGRAAEKAGDAPAAEEWYKTASAYPTSFYGQLALLKRGSAAAFTLPPTPAISREDRRRFEHSDLVQAIKLCLHLGDTDLAGLLLSHIAEEGDAAQAALAAGLGPEKGYIPLGVHVAKKAFQQGVVVPEAGYPAPPTPTPEAIPRALTLAIVRQESEFDARIQSPAGATGLMQLMPKTAREVARKYSLPYAPDQLFDPYYNMLLGSFYLERLISGYDGSYVMAIAAYNAGAGNVHRWVGQFGTPGNNLENAVDWIEKIPFPETRNYVQRVLENMQLYRIIGAEGAPGTLMLGQDLVR